MRVKVCGWEAMRPDNMRMVEPELPQSSGAEGWRKAPATPVISMVRLALREDAGAEGFHAGERGVGVGSGGEVREARRAFGEAGEHGVAVRDGLVAGDGEGALQGAGGADDHCGHSCTSVARGRSNNRFPSGMTKKRITHPFRQKRGMNGAPNCATRRQVRRMKA